MMSQTDLESVSGKTKEIGRGGGLTGARVPAEMEKGLFGFTLHAFLLWSRADREDQSTKFSAPWKPAAVLIAPRRCRPQRYFHANAARGDGADSSPTNERCISIQNMASFEWKRPPCAPC